MSSATWLNWNGKSQYRRFSGLVNYSSALRRRRRPSSFVTTTGTKAVTSAVAAARGGDLGRTFVSIAVQAYRKGLREASTVKSTSRQATMSGGSEAVADFDREQFRQELKVLALKVPCGKIGAVRSKLDKHKILFKRPRLKPIVNIPDNPKEKLVLLDELCRDPKDEGLRGIMDEQGLVGDPVEYTYVLDYKYFTADQVLRQLLPKDVVTDIPTSFETIGHIAHLNLRDEQLPFKNLIGKVLLEKNDRIRTVVNKVESIENQFRVLPMEVIAGVDEMETLVVQHGIRFKLNFAQVYWNSRLEHEHHRLINEVFKRSDCILDMTCGIGPFAVPAALKGCKVYANDLNPKCAEYTKINCKLNKIPEERMPTVYCMDARAFVRHIAGDGETSAESAPPPLGTAVDRPVLFDHAVINLPASGLDFVDVFRGLFDESVWKGRSLPYVHCYTFVSKQEAPSKDSNESEHNISLPQDEKSVRERLFQTVVDRVETLLGCNFINCAEKPVVREVRDVAPNKRMVLISFRIPEEAAFCTSNGKNTHKRQRSQ